jgi:transcriptional regulator GlxA family with amidase domain
MPLMHLEEADFSRINALFDRLQQELYGVMPGRQFIALALLMELLTELARLFSPEQDSFPQLWLIGDAMAYMQKNYSKPITMEQVSKASGISRRNLFRYFKTRINCTPLEYLTRLRLQKVLELMSQSDLTLGEIAMRCGFCDSNYLSKQFSAAYGIPPGRFRKQQRKKQHFSE